MTKKILAILMALVLTFAMSTVALADDEDVQLTTPPTVTSGDKIYTDITSVTFYKTYSLTNNNTTSPQETISFTSSHDEGVPDLISISSVSLEAGAAGTKDDNDQTKKYPVVVTLPTYSKVGTYTYTISETNNKNAGVNYYTTPITLVVTVLQGEDGKVRVAAVHCEANPSLNSSNKTDTFENSYSAGKISVTKNVVGAFGDQSEYFDFTIKLTGNSGLTYQTISTNGNSLSWTGDNNTKNPTSITVNGEAVTFHLKHNETFTLENVPYGVSYEVTETENQKYTSVISYPKDSEDKDDKVVNSAVESVTVTNTSKDGTIDTGISMDSIPYIVLLAVAAFGIVALMMKKRYEA